MKEPATLPFLARPGYRRRRLIEIIRLVPFLGLLMFLIPILWTGENNPDPARTSNGWLYLFAIWFLLIAIAAVLARRFDLSWNPDDPSSK